MTNPEGLSITFPKVKYTKDVKIYGRYYLGIFYSLDRRIDREKEINIMYDILFLKII